MLDIKKIEKSTKIKVDAHDDFLYDIKKINSEIFNDYKSLVDRLEPLNHSHDISCLLREDIKKTSLPLSTALLNAKRKRDNRFICINPGIKNEK